MKMCDDFKKNFIEYHDGSLTGAAKAEMQAHLAECPSCHAEYSTLKRLYSMLDSDEVRIPSPEVFEHIKQQSKSYTYRSVQKKPSIFQIARVLVPACIAAILAIVIFWPRNGSIELAISSSDLLQDEDIARITLPGIVNEELISEFVYVEENLPTTIDEMIDEFTEIERDEFIKALYLRFGEADPPQIL